MKRAPLAGRIPRPLKRRLGQAMNPSIPAPIRGGKLARAVARASVHIAFRAAGAAALAHEIRSFPEEIC